MCNTIHLKQTNLIAKGLKAVLSIVFLCGSLSVVSAQDRIDPRKERFQTAEKEIEGAVRAGKISKEDARKRLEGLKKHLWGDKNNERKDSNSRGRERVDRGGNNHDKRGHRDPREEKFHAAERKIGAAVREGKLSKEEAGKKLHHLKEQIWSDKGKGKGKGKPGDKSASPAGDVPRKSSEPQRQTKDSVKEGKKSKPVAKKTRYGLRKRISSGGKK